MVFVDSSVWVSYLNSEDSRHTHALRVLGALENQEITVTSGIVFEVINFLFKIKGKQPALNALNLFETAKTVEIIILDEELFSQTAKFFKEFELSLTDAQIISAMKKANDPEIVSFDRHFDQVKWVKRIG